MPSDLRRLCRCAGQGGGVSEGEDRGSAGGGGVEEGGAAGRGNARETDSSESDPPGTPLLRGGEHDGRREAGCLAGEAAGAHVEMDVDVWLEAGRECQCG